MKTNKLAKRTIKGFGIGLALLFSFILLPNIEVNAQTTRQEVRRDRRDARQEGYRDGLREGIEDARKGRARSAATENDYRGAGGHNSQSERRAYRAGFVQGYNIGYNQNRRRLRRGY